MVAPQLHIDDPDDEILPASPGRRRAATLVGCFVVLLLVGLLIYWIAFRTPAPQDRSWFGF
jgi:hypothetical protein